MSYSRETEQATAEEWRSLGFYYEANGAKCQWWFVGSKAGLGKLVRLLSEYAINPSNARESEHQHYGPYMYLKITTASQFKIGADGLRGTVEQIGEISRELAYRLECAAPGATFTLDPKEATSSDYRLLFQVRENGFDPASADPQLRLSPEAIKASVRPRADK